MGNCYGVGNFCGWIIVAGWGKTLWGGVIFVGVYLLQGGVISAAGDFCGWVIVAGWDNFRGRSNGAPLFWVPE